MLSGKEITRLVLANQTKNKDDPGKGPRIGIDPFDVSQVNPNSYNLRLFDQLLIYTKMKPLHDWYEAGAKFQNPDLEYKVPRPWPVPLDMKAPETVCGEQIGPSGFTIWPGVLYLASTIEYTETHDLVPCVDGRSGVGRLNVCVHQTAGFGDTSFNGTFTLELSCLYPIKIYPGVQICQISYRKLEGESVDYVGRYQGQRGPQPSRLWKEVQREQG